MSKQTIHTGLQLIPSTGGTTKTIGLFQQALNGSVISFTEKEQVEYESTHLEHFKHIYVAENFLGKHYSYASGENLKEAEAIAKNANLIVCNVMLRYHVHWVRHMSKKLDIPYWFVPHGQLDPYVYTYRSLIKKIWLSVFGKRFMRQASCVIFATEKERKKASWVYNGDNSTVIHWPVNLIPLEQKNHFRNCVRHALGADQHDLIFLYLGRLHSVKKPLVTIQAFAEANIRNAHLVLAGPESDVSYESCRRLIRSTGLSRQIHMVGPLNGTDKEKYLLASDAFVSLSNKENFGHSAAESLAAGTPVILSPGNDLSDELNDYDCGIFLQDNAVETARKGFISFSSIPEASRIEMGYRGRNFIYKKCSFDSFQRALIRLREKSILDHSNR